MKKLALIGLLAAIAAAVTWQLVEAQQTGVKRTDLQRHDISSPGREVIQVRVDLSPGSSFPDHTHPGEEVIYVIEGTFEYRIDGKSSTVKAGQVLFVLAGAVHSAKNVGDENAAELATYIVEKDKPLVNLTE